MGEKPLNARQKKFALELRRDPKRNATNAAIRAGYSPKGADVQASRLLGDVRIRAIIEEADTKVLAEVEGAGNVVLEELAHFAFADPIGIFNESDGTLKALSTMTPAMRRSIKSLKFTELFEGASGEKFVAGRIVDIQFWDKVKGLELLGKNQKLWTDRVEHSADASLTVIVQSLAEKAAK